MAKVDDVNGVWRTVGGRRIFIKDGQDLATAMKESGKFKKNKNQKFNAEDEAFIKDLTEHYDEFTRGDLQGTIEAKYGMGEKGQAILKEVDDRTYEKYKVDTLNNDEYLQANRPNEYFQKMLNDNNVKTLSGDYERDSKGRIVSQKEYDEFREAYKKDLISKEDYRNNNYDALKEKENRIKISNQQETNRRIKNATSQKSLKAMAEAGYAKDITTFGDDNTRQLQKEHGRLEVVKTTKGVYGMNGAILRSRKTGEYFVITSRNSNLFYWV